MIPSASLVVAVLVFGSYKVGCDEIIPCNETTPCTNNTRGCDNGYCHIQPGQRCTIPSATTTTSVSSTTPITSATTPSTTASTTLSATSSITESITESTTVSTNSSITASTTATSSKPTPSTTTSSSTTQSTTTATAASPLPSAGRRKRSTDHQECVSNASCVLNDLTTPMCTCNTGYSEDKGLCTGNDADNLRGVVLSVTMVTTVMLLFI